MTGMDVLRNVVDNILDVVITNDAAFSTQFVSPSVEQALGYSQAEALGTGLLDAVHPEDRPRLECLFRETIDGLAATRIELRIRHGKTGEYRWLDAIGKRLSEPDGRFAGNVVVLRDVTELVETRTRYQEVLDASVDVIFQTDLAGTWRLLSRSWTSLTGYDVGESLGRPVLDFVHPDDRQAIRDAVRAAVQTDNVIAGSVGRVVTKGGRDRWVEFSLSPSRDAAGALSGAAGTMIDRTSRHLRSALDDVGRAIDRQILEGGDEGTMLRHVCEGLAASMAYPVVWLGVKEADGTVSMRASGGRGLGKVHTVGLRWDDSPEGAGPSGTATRTGRTQVVTVAGAPGPWVARAEAAGIKQVAAVPLVAPRGVLGVLCIGLGDVGSLDPEHLDALDAFAARLSLTFRLAEHHALLALQAAAMESSEGALFITDPAGRIEWANAAFGAMSGYASHEVVGRTPQILKSDSQDQRVFEEMWAALRAGQVWRGEVVNRRKGGERYVVSQTVAPLLDEHGKLTHLVAAQEDVTARRAAEALVSHMAHYDALTDLPNRALFADRLEVAIVQAEHGLRPVALLFVDLDRFKLVNDTLGHTVGDELLRQVGARLKGCMRDGDLVARFGGDEFTVLLPASDVEQATQLAGRLLQTLNAPLRVEGHDLYVTASIGIAFSGPDAADTDTLLRHADAAMYRVKERGRNGCAVFDARLDQVAPSVLSIQSALGCALKREQFSLRYQPQIDLPTGTLIGVEALLRWTSPELGAVSPADFIPIAERAGIIVEIDRWVLHTACRQAQAWEVAGVRVPRIAVNVSGVSFRNGQLLATVKDALASSGLAPRRLELELTEGVVMTDVDKVIETLNSLRALGVRIALDDFGTGYSSLSYLKRFKVDALKIDRSFVTGLPGDEDSAAIARLVVAMASALRMETIAEGVETREQAAFLSAIGCGAIQGFLVSKAVSADEVARRILLGTSAPGERWAPSQRPISGCGSSPAVRELGARLAG